MKLLLEDGFSIEKGTGVGRYTQNLTRELGKYRGVEILRQPTSELIRKIRPPSARRIAYAAWLETAFQTRIERLGADLVHFTNHLVPRNRRSRAKYAVTIHDLTAWKLPGAHPSMYERYIRSVISRAVKVADLILCDSDSIRNEVVEQFSLAEERVRTAWIGHSHLPDIPAERREELRRQLKERLGLGKPYVLFVGTLERRKNVTTLVEAFGRVAGAFDLQCVLVGRRGHGFAEIESAIRHQACRERYILTGFVTDEELALLYMHADVFTYPSRYEGFGIPLVEAMSFGLPIVASRIPASEEIAADAAAYYDDPLDGGALAGKILEVLGSSAMMSELGLRGRQRAAKFNWENVARMYIDAYQSCLGAC